MKRILLACFTSCVLTQAWAVGFSATETNSPPWPRKFYVQGGAGGMWPMVNRSHHVWAGPGVAPDYYVSNKDFSDQGLLLAATGVTWVTQNSIVPYYSFGLRYTYVSPFNVEGYIAPNSLPNAKNYFYSYRVSQQNIFGTLKLDFKNGWSDNVMAYFIFGAGMSINQVGDYKEHPINNSAPRLSPAFGSYTNNNFAYIAGLGLDYIFKDSWWINVEYNYGYFGIISTNTGNNYSGKGGLNYGRTTLSNRLTGQSLLVGLSYYLW